MPDLELRRRHMQQLGERGSALLDPRGAAASRVLVGRRGERATATGLRPATTLNTFLCPIHPPRGSRPSGAFLSPPHFSTHEFQAWARTEKDETPLSEALLLFCLRGPLYFVFCHTHTHTHTEAAVEEEWAEVPLSRVYEKRIARVPQPTAFPSLEE